MKIYVCGPTVYNKVHIGNMRPILSFDIFIRAKKYQGEQIDFIHNITDVDDKIINKAIESKVSESDISKKYTAYYFEMLEKLNIEKPTYTPLVTENIKSIIHFIELLIKNNAAYNVNGNVYYDVSSFNDYGKISNQKLDELISDEKGEKKNPLDFALWKKTDVGIQFDSPWGKGRPGWHTECSAFINEIFKGKQLDIHGGGIDLIFPHHENENAQFESINKVSITKEWKHIGHLFYKSEKMSKSIGNVIAIDEFIDLHGIDTLRTIFLMSNVTSPIDIHQEVIENAIELTERFTKVFVQSQLINTTNVDDSKVNAVANEVANWNFSEAMKLIIEEVKFFNKSTQKDLTAMKMLNLIGFAFTKTKLTEDDKKRYTHWKKLREEGKYSEADVLRIELVKKFIV